MLYLLSCLAAIVSVAAFPDQARATSALDVAAQAVRMGDMNGDNSMNQGEFASQLLSNSAFRKATFSALDADKDGMIDIPFSQAIELEKVVKADSPEELEPYNLEKTFEEGGCDETTPVYFLTDAEGSLEYFWLWTEQANAGTDGEDGKVVTIKCDETGDETGDVIESSGALLIESSGALLTCAEPSLHLKSGVRLVYGGDAVDSTEGSMRFVNMLNNAATTHKKNCVTLILGNRDVNKLRLKYEMDPRFFKKADQATGYKLETEAGDFALEREGDDEEEAKTVAMAMASKHHTDNVIACRESEVGGECDLVPHWTQGSYFKWMQKKAKQATPPEEFAVIKNKDGDEQRLKWILEDTMGAPYAFRGWQAEMELINDERSVPLAMYCSVASTVTLEEKGRGETHDPCRMKTGVVAKWFHTAWMLNYIKIGKMAEVIGTTLYAHGGALKCGEHSTVNDFGMTPREHLGTPWQTEFPHSCIGLNPDGSKSQHFVAGGTGASGKKSNGVKWMEGLAKWKQLKVDLWQDDMSHATYRGLDASGGDGVAADLIGSGLYTNTWSVIMGRFSGPGGHFAVEDDPDLQSDIKRLMSFGINRMVIGHLPTGWLPTVTRFGNKHGDVFQFVDADTTYSDQMAKPGIPNPRSVASVVRVDENDIKIWGGIKADHTSPITANTSTPISATYPTIELPAPGGSPAEGANNWVGTLFPMKHLKGGLDRKPTWVKAAMDDKSLLLLEVDGFNFKYSIEPVPEDVDEDGQAVLVQPSVFQALQGQMMSDAATDGQTITSGGKGGK